MSWIWLDKNKYPNNQESNYSCFCKIHTPKEHTVVSFKKEYEFKSLIKKVEMEFTYDTTGYLYLNNELISGTNNKAPEDFLTIDVPVNNIYIQKYTKTFEKNVKKLVVDAKVLLSALQQFDFSSGFGGFYFTANVHLENGEVIKIQSDETWLVKLENFFNKANYFDNTVNDEDWTNASLCENHWNIIDTDLKVPVEEEIKFDNKFVVDANSRKTYKVDFPLVYSAYYIVEVKCDGLLVGQLDSFEIKGCNSFSQGFKVKKSAKFRYFAMVSCGGFILKLNNKSDKKAEVIIHVLHSKYPYANSYNIETNNPKLNDLFKKCKYAVENCSQTLLLDSPKHLEPLASCAGDYNIDSLTNAYASGDFSLIKHHLRGYGDFLRRNNGLCANTSYGLTFVRWLKNIYMFTGDKELLKDCLLGARATIDLYLSYLGDNGLPEKVPHFVFVDWLNVDGINLFSPSKNLGQSVISMFFYDALKSLEFIYLELGMDKDARKMHKEALKLKNAINSLLFDKERGLYIEGLNTPNEPVEHKIYLRENTDKIYYRKHANILAVNYGLLNKSESKKIMHKLFYGEIKDLEVQPYFLHYMLEAIHKIDMDKKYMMKIMKLFTRYIKIKDKGLPEGFYVPHPDYIFDYSHAWTCTPFYSFINASSGLKILEPGMKKIRLKPTYLNVDVKYEIPTPYGNIKFEHKKGEDAKIEAPKEIEIIYE